MRGRGGGLELREVHAAKALGGRERLPCVEHSFYFQFSVFRTVRHKRQPFCTRGKGAGVKRAVGGNVLVRHANGLRLVCDAPTLLRER